jgi:alpha-amylase/alpha-mannosidase (GH57 family)
MPPEPLSVAILWHQHQPHYRDLITGVHLMPWVRLHAVKDYLDMALILEEFPAMRLTINLVPSLVQQLEQFATGEAEEPWLHLAEKPAADLTDEDRQNLLDRFFSAHFDTMIEPHPRYLELHRMRQRRGAELFEEADWRDLQVWFNLAWTDPLHIERDADLHALVAKGAQFTEEDKRLLLAKHRAIIADVVPAHRRLQESGQLEVTTTPLCHPILPLLCNTDWAREARPQIALPKRPFRHPEDADEQIRLALDFMAERLGSPPRGMWPSEGSVCEEVVPLFARAGVQWIATDEEVLAQSLGIPHFHRDQRGRVNDMDALYRPYVAEVDGHRIQMIFRDHALSDFIGFHTAHFDPKHAADSLLARLRDIHVHLRDAEGPHLVSIILDGENCWEYHRDDGLPFLRALYGGLTGDPDLRPVRVSDFLEAHPATKVLPHLHAGSWINHDFGVWIGHPEDNRAWDLLADTRDRVMAHIEANRATFAPDAIERAREAIRIAEGSDWNWWYGDDHSSGNDELFDHLYRRHLEAAHVAVGLDPPPELQIPIISAGNTGSQTQPLSMLEITLDGRDSHFYEWATAGHYDPERGGGAMHRAEHVITELRYGFTADALALRLDLSPSAAHAAEFTAEFLIPEPRGWRIRVPLTVDGRGKPLQAIVSPIGDSVAPTQAVPAAWDQILEILVPWSILGGNPGDRLLVQAALFDNGREVDRAPARAPLTTHIPDEDWEAARWLV